MVKIENLNIEFDYQSRLVQKSDGDQIKLTKAEANALLSYIAGVQNSIELATFMSTLVRLELLQASPKKELVNNYNDLQKTKKLGVDMVEVSAALPPLSRLRQKLGGEDNLPKLRSKKWKELFGKKKQQS